MPRIQYTTAVSPDLGNSLTLDRYGHLYPDDLEAVATAFDAAAQTTADGLRTAPALKVVVSAGKTV